MKKAAAFAPGHISGFFQMQNKSEDLLQVGSRNCGLCIDAGVKTVVEVEESSSTELNIFINNEKSTAKTTEAAVDLLLEKINENVSIKVKHSVKAPVGAGYGMSGAGAIGLVLAFSETMGLDLSRDEVLAKAHEAEVKCKSGLGDVGPQMLGGLVIGLEPGSPPHGKWETIEMNQDLKIICGTKGSLSTSGILNNLEFREKSEKLGEAAMQKLLSDKSLENFMKVSKEFALNLNVFDEEFEEIIEKISSQSPLGASAVLLGRAIFAPVPASKVEVTKEVFLEYFNSKEIIVTPINFTGANLKS